MYNRVQFVPSAPSSGVWQASLKRVFSSFRVAIAWASQAENLIVCALRVRRIRVTPSSGAPAWRLLRPVGSIDGPAPRCSYRCNVLSTAKACRRVSPKHVGLSSMSSIAITPDTVCRAHGAAIAALSRAERKANLIKVIVAREDRTFPFGSSAPPWCASLDSLRFKVVSGRSLGWHQRES